MSIRQKRRNLEKWKKLKNGKCENKNTLKVPKKPSVLDYKNIFIKASIPSITRFFVFFKRTLKARILFFRIPLQLILLFATNEPLPRGHAVIFYVFLTIFSQNSPKKWPKNGLFLAIGKRWKSDFGFFFDQKKAKKNARVNII